jgi:hypothetical protein
MIYLHFPYVSIFFCMIPTINHPLYIHDTLPICYAIILGFWHELQTFVHLPWGFELNQETSRQEYLLRGVDQDSKLSIVSNQDVAPALKLRSTAESVNLISAVLSWVSSLK